MTNASPITDNTDSNAISSTTGTASSSHSTSASITWRHGPGPEKLQTQTGHDYAVDPFGFLGDTGVNPTPDNEPPPTRPSDDMKTEDKKSTDSHMGSTSATATSSTTSQSTATTITSQPTSSASASPASSYILPTQMTGQSTPKTAATANASSSGMSTGAWKIVGIGVVSAIGIVVLVVGFVFHDRLFGAILHRSKDEEKFVPDWKRGSWMPETEEDEVPRINEKGSPLEFPLPPVSPFPLRRDLSRTGNASAATLVGSDYGKGYGSTASVRVLGSDFSIIPSPPPPVHISVTKTSTSGYPSSPLSASPLTAERDRSPAIQKTHKDTTPEEDAYGGIAG